MTSIKLSRTSIYVIIIGILLAINMFVSMYFWNQVNNLQNQIIDAHREIDSLRHENMVLNDQKEKLSREKDELKQQVGDLQKQLSNLYDQVNNYEKIINLEINETLVDHKLINVPRNAGHTFPVETDYAGYLIIRFAASNPVSIRIGSNFMIKEFGCSHCLTYCSYPIGGTTDAGTFYVPVFPGVTSINIYNKGPVDVDVEITVTYVY